MPGLFSRLMWTYKNWRMEKRDAALARKYLNGKIDLQTVKAKAPPLVYLTMLKIDEFVRSGTDRITFNYGRIEVTSSGYFPGMMPRAVACMIWELLLNAGPNPMVEVTPRLDIKELRGLTPEEMDRKCVEVAKEPFFEIINLHPAPQPGTEQIT
jgi:hypothetical protein